jgi:hypothetical protein
MKCKFIKPDADGAEISKVTSFSSFSGIVFNVSSIPRVWLNMQHDLSSHIEDFTNQ